MGWLAYVIPAVDFAPVYQYFAKSTPVYKGFPMPATTWTWKFFDAEVADEGGLTDVLKAINYQLTGTRGEVVHVIGGRCTLGAPDPESFTPFASLTAEAMEAIVGSAVNIEALKTQIDEWHGVTKKPLPFE